tara:strand:+ start:1010 stop:1150 length:141 start_codon:yes stop_codon:yes gene_type:complete
MIGTILILIILGMGFIYWIATAYEDRQFYNRIQRRQELIRRYTMDD